MKKKWLKKKEFTQIKRLLDIGLPVSTVSKAIKRSYNLVLNVRKATNWEGYKDLKKIHADRVKAKRNNTIDLTQEFVTIREALANIERAMSERG